MNGLEVKTSHVRTGFKILDRLLINGIITIRCSDPGISDLVYEILVRNHERGKRILYLHWVDYHKRFWTFDYDVILSKAKRFGISTDDILDDIYLLRAFSRDNNEITENWERIFAFGNLNLVVLDSISELYEEKKENSLPMTYAIGKFVQLCMLNDCTGIVLDRSQKPIHSYLAHTSTVILEMQFDKFEISVSLIKHPLFADAKDSIPLDRQYKLRRWL